MPSFKVSREVAAPVPKAQGNQAVTALSDLVKMDACPASLVSVKGRVQLVFGRQAKYPALKLVLAGEGTTDDEDGDQPVAPYFLVKFSSIPHNASEILVDKMVTLTNAEVRPSWRRADGSMPESALFPSLCGKELSLTISQPGKRKRGAVESSVSILAETGHEGYPKAVFHLLPGLSSVPLDEAETVVSTQVKIVEVGDLVNMERPRRSIVVEDVDGSSSVRANITLFEGHAEVPLKVNEKVAIIGLTIKAGQIYHAYANNSAIMIMPPDED